MIFKEINTVMSIPDGRFDLNITVIDDDGEEVGMDYTYSPTSFTGIALDVGMALKGWVDSGKPISDYIEPEPLPPVFYPLSPVEFRNALIDADIMPADITAAISQIPDIKEREKALNYWNYPTMFHRDNPLIEQIADGFGLTSEDIDQMWLNVLNARQ